MVPHDMQLRLTQADCKQEYKMYVLARHEGEEIIIADVIHIKVLSVTGKIVRLGIDAPREVPIVRVKRDEVSVEDSNNDNKD